MTSLAEKITDTNRPYFNFTVDDTVRRIREHSLALDRCKRFTEIPRLSYLCGLLPIEWAVFAYYYSLAPKNHPSEVTAAAHLKIGRATLVKTLSSLAARGMIFFDTYVRSKLKIVNISHPDFWWRLGHLPPAASTWTDPRRHCPRKFESCPERLNEARDFSHLPGHHVRLPYLLFQTLIHPTAKYIYGLFCYLDINVHPTLKELAASLGCSTRTASTHIAELEDCRMIYSQSRDPENFGDHTRYYHHLTDVALWRTPKAGVWYRGGENSLIARLDTHRFIDPKSLMASSDLDEFRPVPDTSQLLLWGITRQESSQVRQESSQVRQEPSQVRQEELRQESSQIRQKSPEIRQESPEIRQKSFQIIDEACPTPCLSMDTEENNFAKNTFIRDTNNKNTVCKSSRAEQWAPVEVSFHPRIINIAKSAEIVWKAKDYRFDRALWNGAVEEIAKERSEDEAWRFAGFVKKAYYAYGRPFPYTRPVIQDFLDAFRAGKSWSVVLGPGYQDPVELKPTVEGEIQNPPPDAQASVLIVAEIAEHDQPPLDSREAEKATGDISPAAKSPAQEQAAQDETETDDCTPSSGAESNPDPEPARAKSPRRKEEGVRTQITHANLLDAAATTARTEERGEFIGESAVCDKNSAARAQSIVVDTVNEKVSTQRSQRRIELDKAASILTRGLKSEASFHRGFAKLDDDQLYASLLHMFGSARVHMLVTG